MLMFHGNLVHGSAGNYIRKPTRPEFIAHRDFAPIVPVVDDAPARLARCSAGIAAE
jgi:ectoine hydroxylase